MKKIKSIILIYNADAGRWSAVVDSAKKILMLDGCTLCSITHGLFGEKNEWRECREEIGVPVQVFHRDDAPSVYREPAGSQLPCILAQTDAGEIIPLLSPDVMERCKGKVVDLKARLYFHASLKELEFPAAFAPAPPNP